MIRLFEVAFCPALLVTTVFGVWLGRHLGAGWMTTLFASTAFPLVVITITEQVMPYRREWNYPFREDRRAALKELATDLLYALFITRIHSWLLPLVLPALVPTMKLVGKKLGIFGVIAGLPQPVRIAILLLVGELFWYWGHRLQHTVPLFWRFHAAHHVPERLNGLKSARNHPVDLFALSIIGYLPLVALGARARDLMWAAVIQSAINVISHSNVRVKNHPVYAWIFATPDHHRIHHSVDLAESKSNFGCRLMIWDWIFGSARRNASGELVVGVDPRRPRSLKEQLVDPFYREVV